MLRTIGLRLIRLVPVLFLVSLATFFMVELVPGDPAVAILGPTAAPEQYEQVHEELGLDEPVVDRYVDWLGNTVTGDLGRTLVPPVQDVSDLIRAALPVTLEITLLAIGMALLVAVPVALVAAYRERGRFDRATSTVAFAAISVPSFLLALFMVFFLVFHVDMVRWVVLAAGLCLTVWAVRRTVKNAAGYPPGAFRTRSAVVGGILALAVIGVTMLLFTNFPDFPRQGFSRWTDEAGKWANVRSAFLPALTLAITEIAIFMRLLRGDLISTLQEDYILAARAKGMPPWRILVRDALRPSSFSVITVAGVALARLIGSAVIVETIFNIPGMGRLIVQSIGTKDFRVVQAAVLVVAVFYVLVNLIVDISYAYLDPRIRRGRV